MNKATLIRIVSFIGARLREPTTYVGLAAVLGSVLHLSNAMAWSSAIASICIGVGGVIAIVLPER